MWKSPYISKTNCIAVRMKLKINKLLINIIAKTVMIKNKFQVCPKIKISIKETIYLNKQRHSYLKHDNINSIGRLQLLRSAKRLAVDARSTVELDDFGLLTTGGKSNDFIDVFTSISSQKSHE